ncbi:uncharacterized protein LOC128554497 [Mercenaria mercenaria]|uniref:uncharacterized protein LOC128554497 n=1 Tax=Mercenaria mercenaria TaxID=6596 RepID=UPI00234EB2F1|nr:uncharacterized protein LOC128554497 [Mercenaria mercenaria]
MAEGVTQTYDDELLLLHEQFRELQRQNEALKLQNEISSLEREIDSMQMSFQHQLQGLKTNEEDQAPLSSTPKIMKRKLATPLDERRRRFLPPTPVYNTGLKDVKTEIFKTSPLNFNTNMSPRDKFVTFRDRKPKQTSEQNTTTTSNITTENQCQTENMNGEYGSTSKRTVMMKPATYDGTNSWIDYKAHFEACSEINKWTEKEKGLYLSVSLRGQAQGVFGNLTNKTPNYEELVSALQERFSPPNQTELYRAQLRERRQKATESLSEMGQDIRRLTNLAYPSAPSDVRETLAKEQFIDSLISSDMRLRIKQARPTSLNDGVRHAVELEAFNKAERKTLDGQGYLRSFKNTDDSQSKLKQDVQRLQNAKFQIEKSLR